jgi:hypothetical protein
VAERSGEGVHLGIFHEFVHEICCNVNVANVNGDGHQVRPRQCRWLLAMALSTRHSMWYLWQVHRKLVVNSHLLKAWHQWAIHSPNKKSLFGNGHAKRHMRHVDECTHLRTAG